MSERIIGLKHAIPYLRLCKGTTFVVKVGGETVRDDGLLENLAEQISLLHQLSNGRDGLDHRALRTARSRFANESAARRDCRILNAE